MANLLGNREFHKNGSAESASGFCRLLLRRRSDADFGASPDGLERLVAAAARGDDEKIRALGRQFVKHNLEASLRTLDDPCDLPLAMSSRSRTLFGSISVRNCPLSSGRLRAVTVTLYGTFMIVSLSFVSFLAVPPNAALLSLVAGHTDPKKHGGIIPDIAGHLNYAACITRDSASISAQRSGGRTSRLMPTIVFHQLLLRGGIVTRRH